MENEFKRVELSCVGIFFVQMNEFIRRRTSKRVHVTSFQPRKTNLTKKTTTTNWCNSSSLLCIVAVTFLNNLSQAHTVVSPRASPGVHQYWDNGTARAQETRVRNCTRIEVHAPCRLPASCVTC